MNTLSPQTIGVELPRSGKVTRQATFSFVLQRSGRFFSLATPLPPGPRKPGQLAPHAEVINAHQSQATAQGAFMGTLTINRVGWVTHRGDPQNVQVQFNETERQCVGASERVVVVAR